MRSVALVGFAPNTLPHAWHTEADEIWAIVWAYNYEQIPRIDRLFEMHPIWQTGASKKREYVKPREHYLWLQANDAVPVYLLTERPEIPQGRRYPIEAVADELLSGWTRSGERQLMFTSSVDYMMALAIFEGFDRIEICGIEMSSDSEFRYQREGYAFWHGLALGRGIEIVQHEPTLLLHKPKMYGYDRINMIGRQDLERLKTEYEAQEKAALARLQFTEGALVTALETLDAYDGADDELRERLQAKVLEKKAIEQSRRDDVAVASGALQTVLYLLREVDLEEGEVELMNPFGSIVVSNGKEMDG